MDLILTHEHFKKICDFVYDKSGIHLKEGKEALVQARLSKRMRILHINSIEEYIKYLDNNDDDEFANLIDVITTNTTSFFREDNSLKMFEKFIESWIKKGKKKFRIWSAASSTGEEPYTIAMIINELISKYNLINHDIKILATDISPTVLMKAQKGIYSIDKIKNVPAEFKNKYFCKIIKDDIKCFEVKKNLKDMITYRQFNLLSEKYPLNGPLDIILCRNVMIYFDEKTRNTIVRKMHNLIDSGGYFIVGNAESLAGRAADFKLIKPAVYQKK
ncbi:MAG: chemotaxis protein CheR [Candidatus Muirbacterium halophilum]|nr:chemotaxis protein CheR [Candidatus Muirbacterium halophilum]MCK9477292.1 chemotaxis protein CheR [Candidatus Muirbacterium halophilum]